MAVSTSVSSSSRRRRRRLKSDDTADARRRNVTAGILGLIVLALLASLGVIMFNLGR